MAYATVAELGVLINKTAPTPSEEIEMQQALDAAAEEIDWELDYTTESPAPDPPPSLVHIVNLERATEHWKQLKSPFGVIGIGREGEPVSTPRDTWYRHALTLQSLKTPSGVA